MASAAVDPDRRIQPETLAANVSMSLSSGLRSRRSTSSLVRGLCCSRATALAGESSPPPASKPAEPAKPKAEKEAKGSEVVRLHAVRGDVSGAVTEVERPAVTLADVGVRCDFEDIFDSPTIAGFAQIVRNQGTILKFVLALWRDVLKVETIRENDNFFDLGGHSLLATEILLRVRRDFDRAGGVDRAERDGTDAARITSPSDMLPATYLGAQSRIGSRGVIAATSWQCDRASCSSG